MAGLFKIDTSELERATTQLYAENKKGLAYGINKKMVWLLRRWLWKTPAANYKKMGQQLGQELKARPGRADSKNKWRQRDSLTMKGGSAYATAAARNKKNGEWQQAPLLALIINRRRGKKGRKGLYGAAMAKEFRRIFGIRARSIGYLKSGIATAQQPFLKFAGGGKNLPPQENTKPKRYGRAKGAGGIAIPDKLSAFGKSFTNTRKQRGKALKKYAKPALEQAYREELADTLKFFNEELYQAARRVGVKARR